MHIARPEFNAVLELNPPRRSRAVCAAAAGDNAAPGWRADFEAGSCAAAEAVSPVAGFVLAHHVVAGGGVSGQAASGGAGADSEEDVPSPELEGVDPAMLEPLDPDQLLAWAEEFEITL